MQQLVQPNLSVVGKSGWCLDYARRVFGAGVVEATAWQGWENAKYKHTDGLPNVSVPVWFDYWQDGIRYGHVAVYVPGQGVYSSPWQTTYGHAVLNSVQEVERIYGVKYVGWSEDISNVRVASGEEEMITDINILNSLYQRYRGRNASQPEIDQFLGKASYHDIITLLGEGDEAQQAFQDLTVGHVARRDNWEQQINDLKALSGDSSEANILGKVLIKIIASLGYKKV